MLILILFIFGICVGSFLNVLVDRLPLRENPFVGRSHCDYCKKKISATDLIPLFSYILLKGKCRHCKKKLSIYYPVVEVVTGILFVITFFAAQAVTASSIAYEANFYLALIIELLIVSVLIVIFFTDLKYSIIPFAAVSAGTILAFVLHLVTDNVHFLNYLLSGLGAFIGFFILFYLANLIAKGEGMGFGDVVYVFLMGFLLGFPQILLGLYLAFVSGGLFSLALVILKKKKFKGGTIPFGPFLVLGTLVCLFWGKSLMGITLSYLLR